MNHAALRSGIWGLVVGDSLGAPVEFGERWMRDMDPVKEMRSGGIFEVPVGGWTDDTSMILATLDSLRYGYCLDDMMERFAAWMRNGEYSIFNEAIGIGKIIREAILDYEQNGDVRTCGRTSESDNGNGSLMRILPVCLYGYKKWKKGFMTETEVVDMVHEVSALTHAHDRSKVACGLYYFLVRAVIEGTGNLKARLADGIACGFAFYRNTDAVGELKYYSRIENIEKLSRIDREDIKSTGYVVDSLEAAVWCLVTTESFKECLLKAVNLGVDTDTIAAIAGGLAGLYYGYEAIPEEWLDVLQKREWIEEMCEYFDEGKDDGT